MTAEQLRFFTLNQLQVKPQVRCVFDEEALQGLVQSMNEVGQLQPIRVRLAEVKYWIVAGGRRYRAAKLAGLKGLSAIVEAESLDDGGIMQRQLITDIHKAKLTPLERAEAISRLMKATGWNESQAATKLGISNATVTRLLAMLTLPDEIRSRLAAGEISASAAYELSRVADPVQQARLTQQVASGDLTRDKLTSARKSGSRTPSHQIDTAASSRTTAQLRCGRSVTMIGPRDLEDYFGALEELLAKARKVRTQGLALPTFIKMLHDQSKST